jgi:tRNA threonylcarbamoyladenosine biosynthesis protein TsaE
MLPLHAPILETRLILWPDEAHCAATASGMAVLLRRRPALADSLFIELHGSLGAGKTSFVRHLLRALGVQGRIKSPTYTVVETYDCPPLAPGLGPLSVSHFDFYRFDDPSELDDAGLRDVFAAPGLKLCEWPDKAAGRLPAPDLRLHIDWAAPGDDAVAADPTRRVRAEACSANGLVLLHDA